MDEKPQEDGWYIWWGIDMDGRYVTVNALTCWLYIIIFCYVYPKELLQSAQRNTRKAKFGIIQ